MCGTIEQGSLPENPPKDVFAYIGIPYAATTADANRWKPPIAAQPWTEPLAATSFGPACPTRQARAAGVPMSEDCLTLNVWTTDVSSDAPILLFIHGVEASFPSAAVFNGANLAAAGDVVVVTVEYRAGALGYLSGLGIAKENLGIRDQQAALGWINTNARAFGASADRVTLMGQGTGARAVGAHLVAPESVRKFGAAIMQSNPYGFTLPTVDQAQVLGERFEAAAGCVDEPSSCLRDLTVDQILDLEKSALDGTQLGCQALAQTFLWGPNVDGSVIIVQPTGTEYAQPLLMGTNQNDGTLLANEIALNLAPDGIQEADYDALLAWLFAEHAAAVKVEFAPTVASIGYEYTLAEIMSEYLYGCSNGNVVKNAAPDGQPGYAYQLAYSASVDFWPLAAGCWPGYDVCSGAELPLVFGNADNSTLSGGDVVFDRADIEQSRNLMRYWLEFASTRFTPNWQDSPLHWTPFSVEAPFYLFIADRVSPALTPNPRCVTVWDGVGYTRTQIVEACVAPNGPR